MNYYTSIVITVLCVVNSFYYNGNLTKHKIIMTMACRPPWRLMVCFLIYYTLHIGLNFFYIIFKRVYRELKNDKKTIAPCFLKCWQINLIWLLMLCFSFCVYNGYEYGYPFYLCRTQPNLLSKLSKCYGNIILHVTTYSLFVTSCKHFIGFPVSVVDNIQGSKKL